MKISFDRVVINLKSRKYHGKIQSADFANTGLQLFDERKFADQLGVRADFLRDIGLVQVKEFSGWHLPAEPTVEALLGARSTIEREAKRIHLEWLKWKKQ